jgi:oligopeptidase B
MPYNASLLGGRARQGGTLLTDVSISTALLLVTAPLLFVVACAGPGGNAPPRARTVPRQLEAHGDVRVDDYYWLKDRDDPAVVSYLEAENAYLDAVMKPTQPLQKKLLDEIIGRIKQDDASVPFKRDDYWYHTRYEKGDDYPIFCRRKNSLDAPEEIMLDANELAEGHEFFSVGGLEVSSGQDILAFATDTVGRRFYDVRFKDLTTGETLPDVISKVTGNVAWANDNRTLFYSRQDQETLRSYRIFRHILGTDPVEDEVVYEETDETYDCHVFKTKSKKYVMIATSTTLADEYRYLEADDPDGTFETFLPRRRGHEYSIDHYDDRFFIRTNDHAKNFRLMSTPVDATSMESWTEVIPHRDGVYLSGFEIFKDHLVVSERKDGLVRLRVMPWSDEDEHYVEFEEPAYVATIGVNPSFDTTVLRFNYESMATPDSVYDYDMAIREKTLMKRDEVLGGFDPSSYAVERLYAEARDRARVPVSLVYRKGVEKDGGNPLLLYAYGSYGYSRDPDFGSARISLLDRGFVFAIAHVRGGQELGRQWYDDGKLLKKMNTFTDFVDVAEFLVDKGYTSPEHLYAQGGSAGGLLVGAVVNLRPDLFNGAIAQVPFVDVITTMLDDSIPLTTSEYDEWGDPNVREYYDYMLAYSPYDNVEPKAYPNLLVTTGLHDSQVQYWEPAKWVAKLRATRTDDNLLLLKTNMDAGHGGTSGRLKGHKDTALEYAFLLALEGQGADGGGR